MKVSWIVNEAETRVRARADPGVYTRGTGDTTRLAKSRLRWDTTRLNLEVYSARSFSKLFVCITTSRTIGSITSYPYCLFKSSFTDSAERWLPLLTELTEAGELFWGLLHRDAGSAVSDSFGSEVRQFAKSLFVSKLMFGTRLMHSLQR